MTELKTKSDNQLNYSKLKNDRSVKSNVDFKKCYDKNNFDRFEHIQIWNNKGVSKNIRMEDKFEKKV
jgi:hypothetical protein